MKKAQGVKERINPLYSILAGSIIATSFMGSAHTLTIQSRKGEEYYKAHEDKYGTIQEPRYVIQSQTSHKQAPYTIEELKAITPEAEELVKKVRECEQEERRLLFMQLMIESGANYRQVREGLDTYDKQQRQNMSYNTQLSSRPEEAISQTSMTYQEGVRKYGPIQQKVEKIVYEMTNRWLPKTLEWKIIEEEPQEGARAIHRWEEEQIIIQRAPYAGMLTSGLHEAGHAIQQAQEQSSIHPKGQKGVEGIEEAAAYLFSLAAAHYVAQTDEELSQMMQEQIQSDRRRLVANFIRGSNEEHAVGWAIAESLLGANQGRANDAYNRVSKVGSFKELSDEELRGYRNLQNVRGWKDRNDKDLAKWQRDLGRRQFLYGVRVRELRDVALYEIFRPVGKK